MRFEGDFGVPGREIFTIDVSVKPVMDEQGKMIMVILEGRDVTHHKRIENELREEIGKRIKVEGNCSVQSRSWPKKRCAWGCTPPRTPFFRELPGFSLNGYKKHPAKPGVFSTT